MSLTTLAVSAHLFAMVALVGYYAVLALIVAPVIAALDGEVRPLDVMAAVQRRAMPVLVVSLIAFFATGVFLLTADPRYAGAGNVGGAWASLLLVKHVVIVVMVVLGSLLDGLIVRAAGAPAGEHADRAALTRVLWASRCMALLGVVVLVLTAAAQAA